MWYRDPFMVQAGLDIPEEGMSTNGGGERPWGPSPYEEAALGEIHAWRTRKPTALVRLGQVVGKPLGQAGEALFEAPHVGDIIRKTASALLDLANDAAQWSAPGEHLR